MFKKVHVFRVMPGQELLSEISRYCRLQGISSAVVMGLIGSVESARLNYLVQLPGKYETVECPGPLEIVCGQGSVALKEEDLILHIHLQLSGKNLCRGGHLAEAKVFSTGEVTLGELDYPLRRQFDSYTGLNELLD